MYSKLEKSIKDLDSVLESLILVSTELDKRYQVFESTDENQNEFDELCLSINEITDAKRTVVKTKHSIQRFNQILKF